MPQLTGHPSVILEWLTALLEYLNLLHRIMQMACRWVMGNKELINVGLTKIHIDSLLGLLPGSTVMVTINVTQTWQGQRTEFFIWSFLPRSGESLNQIEHFNPKERV